MWVAGPLVGVAVGGGDGDGDGGDGDGGGGSNGLVAVAWFHNEPGCVGKDCEGAYDDIGTAGRVRGRGDSVEGSAGGIGLT